MVFLEEKFNEKINIDGSAVVELKLVLLKLKLPQPYSDSIHAKLLVAVNFPS